MNSILNFTARVAICISTSTLTTFPITAQTTASELTTPADWKQLPLLGDRLGIFVPPQSKVEARSYAGIMGTATDATSKTRVRVPNSGTEIVVQARSLNALAPKNMSSVMKSMDYLAGFKGEQKEFTLDLGGGWAAIAIVPQQYKYWSKSYLLAYVWIKDPNGLLFELLLGSWANANVYYELSQTAVRIVRSLHPSAYFQEIPKGTTTLDSEIALQNNAIELVVDLDGKQIIETETGLSFVVHRVSQLVEIGSDAGKMGIYLGRYPSFDPDAALKEGAKAIPDQVKILGQTPIWIVDESDGRRKQSTLLEVLPGTTELKCHIFISGTPEQAEALVSIARSLRIRPKP